MNHPLRKENFSSKYAVFIIFRLGQARPWATTDSSGVLSDHELFPVPLPCSPTHSFSRLSRAIFTPYLSPPSQSKVLFLPLPIPKLLHSTWSHVWPKPKTVGYDKLLWGFVRPRTFPCSSSLLSYPEPYIGRVWPWSEPLGLGHVTHGRHLAPV